MTRIALAGLMVALACPLSGCIVVGVDRHAEPVRRQVVQMDGKWYVVNLDDGTSTQIEETSAEVRTVTAGAKAAE